MTEQTQAMAALGRAGRRAAFHLLQAAVEGLKALEAVMEELGSIGGDDEETDAGKQRIDVE